MPYLALTCPQCGGGLPRQAWWRMVNCSFCGAVVTRSEDVVQAAGFHEAWRRAMDALPVAVQTLRVGDARYRMLAPLGGGEHAAVYLAERLSFLPERVLIKIAHAEGESHAVRREHEVLCALQALNGPGAAYFSTRLPQPVRFGQAAAGWQQGHSVLVLRYPVGYWGSMADVLLHQRHGIGARHVVWIWRRVLDILAYIHGKGWTHGRLSAEHLLVQPRDHGILVIGWRTAHAGASCGEQAEDLRQAAWCMRGLLCGGDDLPAIPATLPTLLGELLQRASEDHAWCEELGAGGIDEALRAAAREVFGAPRFVAFSPLG